MAPVRVFADPVALGRALADRIADGIEVANQAGRPYLLGCPGGRSAQTTYTALAGGVRERRLDVSQLVIVMMDEYVLPVKATPGTYEPVADGLPHSCRGFGRDQIAGPLGVAPANLWLPDPADPAAYDRRIAAAGGIDLFVLASGASDGHIAFNPPGSPADSTTRIVELPESTRRDNLVTFPTFESLAGVPTHGVTVGIGTIGALSRQAILILHGEDKVTAAARITATERYDSSWPASVVHACEQPEIFVDKAAAGGPPR
ncbi:6-phosphogluconolactonase [Flindersiella endophytica]